jgi:RNA polymerase sigma-70 factor (ECF subfamily)
VIGAATNPVTDSDRDRDERMAASQAAIDARLVSDALANRDAFAALYVRYADRLYRYALAHTGAVSAAEDIVSETMLAAIEGLERFDPQRGAFAGWLFGIAGRQVSARRRRQHRFLRVLPRVWEPERLDDDPLTTIVRGADATRLREHLAQLPDRDREIVLLRYGAELTSAEIGEVLGMKSSAVRVRLMRALDRLAGSLGDVR